MAVAWGTPMPSTWREVQAAPGPTPTRTPTAPVRMRWSAVAWEAQPPTITGISRRAMNSFRLSGSVRVETCSAETTVPWMTRMSSSASSTRCENRSTRCGVREAAATAPDSFSSAMRRRISSSLIGS